MRYYYLLIILPILTLYSCFSDEEIFLQVEPQISRERTHLAFTNKEEHPIVNFKVYLNNSFYVKYSDLLKPNQTVVFLIWEFYDDNQVRFIDTGFNIRTISVEGTLMGEEGWRHTKRSRWSLN